MDGTRRTETEEREAPRGPRIPWISTIEPTGFWGAVLLLWAFGTLTASAVLAFAAWQAVGHLRQIQFILGK